ncbi:MAG: carbohydrate ABC transporter permease [Acetanaerobacterium sp.]
MFKNYKSKAGGVIRFYDLHSKAVVIGVVVVFLICIGMAVVALFPPLWIFLASFKDIKEFRREPTLLPSTANIQVFIDTWNSLKFYRFYLNSLIAVVGSCICAVVFNGLLAYGLGILKPKGHKVVFGMVMWSLLIPTTTSIVALYINISRLGLTGSFIPIWFAMGANAFYVILFKQFFESVPKDILEAATIDGCGSLQTFFRMLLPLSKAIIVVVLIFAFTAAWSDFLLPYLLLQGSGKETVMVRLFMFRAAKTNEVDILRAIAFSIIPPIILFVLFQKQITNSVVAGAIKG